jgi:hypothetical protein
MIRPRVITLNSHSSETKFVFLFLNVRALINPYNPGESDSVMKFLAGNGLRKEILTFRHQLRKKCAKLKRVKSGK